MRRNGFSLIELMVVVTLIGVTAGLAAPAMTDSLRDRKANLVARDMVRLFRNAAALSLGRGTAHMVSFMPALDNARGRLHLYVGTTPTCIHTDWTTQRGAATGDDCDGNDNCIDSVRALDYLQIASGQGIKIQGHQDLQNFCYQTGALSLHGHRRLE